MKFLLFSDLHHYPGVFMGGTWEHLREIQRRAEEENCEFLIHAGDFCHGPTLVPDYVKAYNDFHIPSYHCLGNHDSDKTSYEETLKYYNMPNGYYFFDNGGSGFNIGRDAIKYALLCEERNMPKTSLYESVLSKCKTDTVRKNLGNFYKYGKMYVAQFARCVTETIHTDIHSAEIFDNNMSCVAEIINYAFTLLDGVNRVYITGGLTSQKELIIEYLDKYLYKDNIIEFVDKKTVIGALMLAGLEAEIC